MDEATLARLNEGASATARVERVDMWDDGRAQVERFRLGNGLRIIVWEDHTAPVFAYQTWFRVGSRHEERGKTGIAHLFEHMMFKATANHPDGDFDTIMESRGAQTNAATWVDWTYYREKLPSGNLELVVELEADRMEHLILDHAQLESEREVVKNERLMRVDNDPDGRMYETLYQVAYTAHSYGWPTIGWMEDICALTLEDCRAFYERYYAPNNATVVIVGDVETESALALVQRYYGHLPAAEIPAEDVAVEPTQTEERRRTLTLPLSAPRVMWAYHALAATDPAFAALEVLGEVLGGGESSLLYRELVTDLELCTEVSAWSSAWAQPGLFEIGLTLHPDRSAAEAERELERLLAVVCEAPVSQRELDKAINGIEAGLLRGAADTGSRARRLGNAEAISGDYRDYWRHHEALRRVTAEDVLAVARAVLRPDGRTAVVGLPSSTAASTATSPPEAA